jgi:hypothetical protein
MKKSSRDAAQGENRRESAVYYLFAVSQLRISSRFSTQPYDLLGALQDYFSSLLGVRER